jgi:hypothetical protein
MRFIFKENHQTLRRRFAIRGIHGYLCKDNHTYWFDKKYNKHTLIYHLEKNFINLLDEIERDCIHYKIENPTTNCVIEEVEILLSRVHGGNSD